MVPDSERPVRPGMPLRAVVFDLDDTLVVSTVDFPKFKAMVIDRIEALGDDRSVYDPSETVVAILERFEARMKTKGARDEDVREMMAEMDRIMDGVELEKVDETEPLPGAVEILAFLKERGVKTGVLTRGCPEYARRAMAKAGIGHLVDAVEARNSESRPKPYPDSYIRLVSALGVGTAETVFVGDHAIDARCASNAGVAFIGVRTGDVPDSVLMEAGAFLVLDDVRQLKEHLKGLV